MKPLASDRTPTLPIVDGGYTGGSGEYYSGNIVCKTFAFLTGSTPGRQETAATEDAIRA